MWLMLTIVRVNYIFIQPAPGLCSDHFNEKFMNITGQVVKLRDDAIPTKISKTSKEGNCFKIII